MESMRMMENPKRQSFRWWFGNRNASPGRSQWLQSTLSELDEKTKAMLKIIEEDADSFAKRAEMFYKKRPQLVTMVQDFYRAHRSLAEQFDQLRHDPNARRASPLARSFSVSATYSAKAVEGRKSCDSSFSKTAYDSEDFPSYPLLKGSSEKSMDLVKPPSVRHTEIVYDSEESMDSERSEVDDPASEVNCGFPNTGEERDLMSELVRLREENTVQKKELMDKDKKMEELNRKLRDSLNEVMKVKEEAEKFRLENAYYETMNLGLRDESLIQKKELMDKDKKIEKLSREVCGFMNEATKMKEEAERLKVKHDGEIKELAAENAALRRSILKKDEENRELMKQLEEKDEVKRETIRQMSYAVEVLKGENQQLKKSSSKRWNTLEFQMLKEGFGNMFNH